MFNLNVCLVSIVYIFFNVLSILVNKFIYYRLIKEKKY